MTKAEEVIIGNPWKIPDVSGFLVELKSGISEITNGILEKLGQQAFHPFFLSS